VGEQARNTTRQQRLARAAAARRRAKRNRILAACGGLVVVGLLVAIGVTLVNAAGGASRVDGTVPTTLVTPAGATAAGAIRIGNLAAPVRVEVYLDYMCPYCDRFDHANADEINRMIAAGTARLDLYPMSFLDKMSNGTRYSTRAANAVATVADRAPDKVLPLTRALFAQQPAEGSRGLTDDQIANLARGAGVPQDVIDTFADRTFEPWIAALTDKAFAGGITATPTVKINGTAFKDDLYTAGPLTEAVTAAKGQ
jgi:protein-disulfide isomerase